MAKFTFHVDGATSFTLRNETPITASDPDNTHGIINNNNSSLVKGSSNSRRRSSVISHIISIQPVIDEVDEEDASSEGRQERKSSSVITSVVTKVVPDKSGQGDGDSDRKQWGSQWEFIFSCISVSVGLGNIWRFPVSVSKHGGGAFLVPYFCILFLVGRPVYFLELCLGQFGSRNSVRVWDCAPLFKGVGFGTMVTSICLLSYYCSIVAISMYYCVRSFESPLPWSVCAESWAGVGNCNGTSLKPGVIDHGGKTMAELFFKNEVLKEIPNIDKGIGKPDWKLSLCLVASWLLIYLINLKGVKSSGKVAYFTALFPYIVLLILLVKAVTMPGASDGISYLMTPNWGRVLEPAVWYEATEQCFFSLSTGLGAIIFFGSFNPFHYNIHRASLIFCLVDAFTSLLAGLVTFALLGNLSYEMQVEINSVVKDGGIGTAFVAYPNAIAQIEWAPQFLAVVFFLMLFTLGQSSVASSAAAICAIFCDHYSDLREWIVSLCICGFGCAVGLVYVTPGGQFILALVDYFGGAFLLYSISALQVIGVAWCYGLFNFIVDVEFMLGFKLGWFWKCCWGFVIPVFLAFTLVFALATQRLDYNGVEYPPLAMASGWMLAVVALGSIVLGAVYTLYHIPAPTLTERFRLSLQPLKSWRPRDPKDAEEWRNYILQEQHNRRSITQRMRHIASSSFFWNKR